MLDVAIRHNEELQIRYRETLFNPRYKFYLGFPEMLNFIPMADSGAIQMVSLNEHGAVIGYIGAKINRITKTAYDHESINFLPGKNDTFTQDIADFDLFLFNELGMDRIIWSVIIGNPVEKLYDRYVDICGTRIVGTFRNEVMLPDGQLYDLKYYEVLKEDFFRTIAKNGAKPSDYRNIGKEVYVQ